MITMITMIIDHHNHCHHHHYQHHIHHNHHHHHRNHDDKLEVWPRQVSDIGGPSLGNALVTVAVPVGDQNGW